MKRLFAAALVIASATLSFAASQSRAAGPSDPSNSPYPAALAVHRGLTMSNAVRSLSWGTTLSPSQARWVALSSSGPGFEWGVWKRSGGPAQFAVRSIDGGAHWKAAGPLLATDWVGGGIYFITRVISESPSAVVMASGAVIDVTADAGHHWYQYLDPADIWSITRHAVSGGGIGIRIGPASYAKLPKGSYAIYVLDLDHRRWRRIAQSLS